jgi:hypothetical protein
MNSRLQLLSLIFLLILQVNTKAQTFTGGGGNSLWSNPSNWSGGAVPVSGANVVINNGFKVIVNTNVSINSLTIEAPNSVDYSDVSISGFSMTLNLLQLVSSNPSNAVSGFQARLTIGNGATVNVVNSGIIFMVNPDSNNPSRAIIDMSSGNGILTIRNSFNFTDHTGQIASNLGSLLSSSTSQIQFNQTGTQLGIPVLDSFTYNNVIINDNGQRVFLTQKVTGANFRITGNLSVLQGTYDDNNNAVRTINTLALGTNQTFSVASGARAKITHTNGLPGGFTFQFNPGSAVEFASPVAQTVTAFTYDSLIISNTGNKTINGPVTVNTGLRLSSNLFTNSNDSIIIESTNSNAIKYSSNTMVVGNLTRKVASGGAFYPFPIANNIDNNLKLVEIAFNSLTPQQYITASHSASNSASFPFSNIQSDGTTFEDLSEDYWTLKSGIQDATYTVNLYGNFTSGASAYTVARTDGVNNNPWAIDGTIINDDATSNGLQTNDLTNQIFVSRTGLPGLGHFAIAQSLSGPLPVDLIYFSPVLMKGFVKLNWATYSESKSSHFIVERSRDAETFESIASINSAGNSSTKREYSYDDFSAMEAFTDILYYRLKQVDVDGQFKIYPIKEVILGDLDPAFKINIYPNPANKELHITSYLKDNFTMQVYSSDGKLLSDQKIKDQINIFETSRLPRGIYLFKFMNGATSIDKKIILE